MQKIVSDMFTSVTTTVSKVLYHWLVQASLLIVKIQTDLDDQVSNKIVIKKKMVICEVFLIPPKRYHVAWVGLLSLFC